MIQQNLRMSRDTKKILIKLDEMASNNGVMVLHTITQIYKSELVMLKYYYNPVSNLLDTRISSIKNKSSKHYQMDYWDTIIDLSFKNNMSVLRGYDVLYDNIKDYVESFQYISSYLLTDYSIYDSKLIYDIIHTYKSNQIKEACKIGIKYKVYNVQYIHTILQNMQAQENIKINKINAIVHKTDESNNILYQEKQHNQISDIARMAYEWDSKKEDAEIEKKFNEMFGGNNEN